jgi:prolyl-tRNA synthetase
VINELGLNKDGLEKIKACEVGNIFNLGTKYSKPLGLEYLSEINTSEQVLMGCYGIGISRLMGVIAEVLSDDKGLVWPSSIAPALVVLILLGDDDKVVRAADELYNHLTEAGIGVLYDDRSIRAGEKFADADLIGTPYRVVVSDKTVEHHKYELKARLSETQNLLTMAELVATLRQK